MHKLLYAVTKTHVAIYPLLMFYFSNNSKIQPFYFENDCNHMDDTLATPAETTDFSLNVDKHTSTKHLLSD